VVRRGCASCNSFGKDGNGAGAAPGDRGKGDPWKPEGLPPALKKTSGNGPYDVKRGPCEENMPRVQMAKNSATKPLKAMPKRIVILGGGSISELDQEKRAGSRRRRSEKKRGLKVYSR